jgi:iron(III) transport system substrate-binding protein
MKAVLFILGFVLMTSEGRPVAAQSVTLYTAGPAGLANGVAKAFTDKTGSKVEVYQATSGDVLARLEAEKGRPRADVIVLASWGEGLSVRDRGLVETYNSPEAKKLRREWVDHGLAAQGGAALALIVNSALVKKEEQPQSWFDLTSPFWKDALTMPDPTLSGSAAEFIAVFAQVSRPEGMEAFRRLGAQRVDCPGPQQRRAKSRAEWRQERHPLRCRLHLLWTDCQGRKTLHPLSRRRHRGRPAADIRTEGRAAS